MNILHTMHAYIHLIHMYTSQKIFLCSLNFYQLIHYLKSPFRRGFHKFQLHFYIFWDAIKRCTFFQTWLIFSESSSYLCRLQVTTSGYLWCQLSLSSRQQQVLTHYATAENTTVILTLSAIWCQECYFGSRITCFAYNARMCCRARCEGHKEWC